MPNDILMIKDVAEDGHAGPQTVNVKLLLEILQELKTISKKLDNLHRLYKP